MIKGSNKKIDLQATPRFKATIDAKGSLKPGQPMHLSLNVRANLPTKSAQIKLFLPEVHALKHRKGNKPAVIPVGKPLEPQGAWSQSLSKGQVFTQQKTITIKKPGYYHAVLSVKGKGKKKQKELPIVNSASHDIWFLITKKGGKATQKLNRSLFPKNIRPQPGPFTKITASPAIIYTKNGEVAPSVSGTVTVSVQFLDQVSDSLIYLKDALSKYYIYDSNDNLVDSGSKQTNAEGEITFPCTDGGDHFTVKVYTDNNKTKVYDGPHGTNPTTEVSHTPGLFSQKCGRTVYMSAKYFESQTFNTMNQVIDNSRAFFQVSRGLVPVYIQSGGNVGYYIGGSADYIEISSGNIGDPQGYGRYTVAHEYGHALQEKALGGIPPHTCPDPHYYFGISNLGCAYTEGFANYHAAVTTTNQHPYFEAEDVDLGPDPDGSIVEAGVVSFLWDLTDPTNESFDNTDYPGSYIANVIKGCRVKVNGSLKHPDGIDEFIACLQDYVPYYWKFFPTGDNAPSGYSEDVTEPSGWNRTDIRKLWYYDLYDETYTPPTPPPAQPSVTITGPDELNSGESGTWTAHLKDYNGSVYYKWVYSYPYGSPDSDPIFKDDSTISHTFTINDGSRSKLGFWIVDVMASSTGEPIAQDSKLFHVVNPCIPYGYP